MQAQADIELAKSRAEAYRVKADRAAEEKRRADEIQMAQSEAAKEQARINADKEQAKTEAAKEQAKREADKELALMELELKAQVVGAFWK